MSYTELIGIEFVYGGQDTSGFDCYGLVRYLKKQDGIDLPDYGSSDDRARIAAMMAAAMTKWKKIDKRPGAVVLFRAKGLVSHVGLVIDDDKFIHTWERSGGVAIERLSSWENMIHGYYEYAG